MEKEQYLSITNRWVRSVLRILTLITLFLATFSTVEAILLFRQGYGGEEISLLILFLYLIITPLSLISTLFLAIGIHGIAKEKKGDSFIVLGAAGLILAAVDNLVYISIYRNQGMLDFFILGGLELVCLAIIFLFFQGFGSRSMTICAGVLYLLSIMLEFFLDGGISNLLSIKDLDLVGWYMLGQKSTSVCLAVIMLVLSLFIENGIVRHVKK